MRNAITWLISMIISILFLCVMICVTELGVWAIKEMRL